MQYYLIMCRSLTYAQRAQRVLERAGIGSAVVKAPQEASGTGCTYGVRVPERKLDAAVNMLRKSGLPLGKTYRYNADGSLSEVSA